MADAFYQLAKPGNPATPPEGRHVAVLGTHSLVRGGLVSLLKSFGYEHVEDALTIDDLIQRAEGDTGPEILLVNLVDFVDVCKLMRKIKIWAPNTKVVFLSDDLNMELLSGCFAAGASGYLLENLTSEALDRSLALVRAGEKVFPSELAGVISEIAIKPDIADGLAELQSLNISPRETRILRLLADGQSNKAIAWTLQIAESTVKIHLSNILHKLHVSNRTQAALWAVRRGVVLAEADNVVAAGRTPGDILDYGIGDPAGPAVTLFKAS